MRVNHGGNLGLNGLNGSLAWEAALQSDCERARSAKTSVLRLGRSHVALVVNIYNFQGVKVAFLTVTFGECYDS